MSKTDKPQSQTPAHQHPSRRDFVGSGLTAGALLAASYASGAQAKPSKSPNEKLNIAYVGTQGRAWASIDGTKSENQVALCDVDSRSLGRAAKMVVDRHKQKRIILATRLYLARHEKLAQQPLRFDVVAVESRHVGKPSLTWIRDAFRVE